MTKVAPLNITKFMRDLLRQALAEDLGAGDVTTQSIFPERIAGEALFTARARGIVCGEPVVRALSRLVDPRLKLQALKAEGAPVAPGQALLSWRGDLRSILAAERVCLNFLQRLSGIATLTRSYVDVLGKSRSRIYDTRKTTPLWRALERYAVRVGGGVNHRFGLFDAILIKDNHIDGAGGITAALEGCWRNMPARIPVIVETRTLAEVREAVACQRRHRATTKKAGRLDVIMLDNMNTAQLRRALALIPPEIAAEISGGVTRRRLRTLARLGATRISIGALTHSAPALDISLNISSPKQPAP
jgi:nicotinate-nucleotide pyrophosphorylase (carboxylating)